MRSQLGRVAAQVAVSVQIVALLYMNYLSYTF